LFDIPDGKIIGKTDFEIFPRDFAKEFRKNDIKVLEVNKPVNIEEIVPLDGETHTYISVKFPLYKADGSVYAVCGISTDITERKQMEEELKNTRNYLKNVFNSLPSMLVSVTPEGIITQWNTAAEKHTGISTNRALSQKIWDVAPFLKNYQNNLEEVIITQQPQEFHRERMFGSENRFFNISIYPLVYNGSDGAVIRVDDITELERKDAQLRQAQKMETVGNLAGGLAHDFNNVLGGITGTISLMKYLLEEEKIDLEEMKNSIDIIEMASNRAADMVQQLLTLSRRHDLSFAPVDLNTSVKHVVKICENTFDKSIHIKTNYFEEDAMVKADPNQIEQVLLNLCVNASHAMTIMRHEYEPQGGTLTISIEKIKADSHFCASHPQANRKSEYWILRVRDTGVGMESETLSKIFDPFFTRKKRYNGTGLGLAMVFNIVEEHKGFIDVYSELGIGSTFNIFLPVLKKSKEVRKEKTEKVEIPKGSGLILVIDDEEIMRNTAENILKECGYDVILAKDGAEAIKIYKEIHDEIQAVLLDMAMPRLSGKATYMEMKKINPDVKIVLSSGFKQDKRVKEVMKMGVSGFIQKPYTMIDLAIKIKRVVG
jgi:PAS domain S-box-containing protein